VNGCQRLLDINIFVHAHKSANQPATVAELWQQFAGLLISMIAIDSDSTGDTFEVSLSLSAILFSAVSLSIIAILLDCIANNLGSLCQVLWQL
jgi:hypothetical protein